MKTRNIILLLATSLVITGCTSIPRNSASTELADHFPNAHTAPLQIEFIIPNLSAQNGILTLLKGTNKWTLCFASKTDHPQSMHQHVPIETAIAEKSLRNASYLINHGYKLKFGEEHSAKKSVMRVTMTLASGDESADSLEMRRWNYPQDFDDVPELRDYCGRFAKELPALRKLIEMDTQPTNATYSSPAAGSKR